MNKKVRQALIALGGFLFIVDRLLKYFSIGFLNHRSLLCPFLGWYPSANRGIAFSIPVPPILVIIFSLIFIAALFWIYRRDTDKLRRMFIVYILLGAVSNIIDRLAYGHTLDYFLLVVSVINIADILIVGGVAGYIFFQTRTTK